MRGNFYVIIRIVVPKTLTKQEEELYIKLKNLQTKVSKEVVNK